MPNTIEQHLEAAKPQVNGAWTSYPYPIIQNIHDLPQPNDPDAAKIFAASHMAWLEEGKVATLDFGPTSYPMGVATNVNPWYAVEVRGISIEFPRYKVIYQFGEDWDIKVDGEGYYLLPDGDSRLTVSFEVFQHVALDKIQEAQTLGAID